MSIIPSLCRPEKEKEDDLKVSRTFSHPLVFVRMVRLELTQANAHYPLKVACLPFHHIRITLGLQK